MRRGFTLLELSIVLVIIGLIVGGVVVGQEMIKSSQIRSIITDLDQYRTAVNTFKIKYNCLPGDCPNATAYFGTYNGPGNCLTGGASAPSTAANQTTCNGNGDGMIWFLVPGDPYFYSYERNRFWQHLSAAGLVAGQYSGIGNMSGGQGSLSWASDLSGYNKPASKWPNTGFSIMHSGLITGLGLFFPASTNNKNKFALGAETICTGFTSCAFTNTAGIRHIGPIFSGADAFNIDSKIDDGMPGTGTVTGTPFSNNGYGLYCSTTNSDSTALYRISGVTGGVNATSLICPLIIDAGF